MNITTILYKVNLQDIELNALIQQLIDQDGLGTTVSQWRLDNAKELRRAAHPNIADIIDAQRKIREGDSAGQTELDTLDAQAAAVKIRFPKE